MANRERLPNDTSTDSPKTADITTGNSTNAGSGFGNITKEVVSAFAAGDHRAFDQIYLRCFEPIRGFFCMLLRNESVAEELTQELFVHLWENRRAVDPRLNFKSYIYTVAKSSAMKYLRHKRVVEKYEGFRLVNDPESAGTPDEGLIARELQLMMQISLDSMPRQRRKVFEMSRLERLSNPEIAMKLGISESTVRAHLHNATRKLREIVGTV